MSEAPKRRWFRFSLRTMFVVVTLVAVFLAWLGWELSYIRERKAWLRQNDFYGLVTGVTVWKGSSGKAQIPWWRTMLGDEAVGVIQFPAHWPDEQCDHAMQLFPEMVDSYRCVNYRPDENPILQLGISAVPYKREALKQH